MLLYHHLYDVQSIKLFFKMFLYLNSMTCECFSNISIIKNVWFMLFFVVASFVL